MPRAYSNVNIDCLFEDEEMAKKSLGFFIDNAKHAIKGYKYLYLRYDNGSMEAHLTEYVNEKEKCIEFNGINVHCSNENVWKLKVITVLERNYDDYVLALCSSGCEHGMCPICFINPDVLPRIGEGDTITAQIAAFPVSFDIYENEEAFNNTLPEWNGVKGFEVEKGSKLGIADGTILPIRFLSNHEPPKDGSSINPEDCTDDDIVLIRGTIQQMTVLPIKFGEAENKFLKVRINTQFGDLDLYIGADQIGDTKMKVGDIIVTSCVISADVAIYEYDKGAIFDQENLYLLLLDALESGDYSRIENCLAEDCHYLSKWSGKDITGKNEIIAFMKSVHEEVQKDENKDDFYFLTSYIEGLLENGPDDVGLPQWKIGDKCILEGYRDELKAAFFLSVEDKKITRIDVDTDHRYKFFISRDSDNE